MTLNVTVTRTNTANAFTAGSTVATIYASGGTSPYAYELATGGEYFQISGTNIQVKADMNIDNLQSFSVVVTDSVSPAEEYTTEVMYPRIYATLIQNKFSKTNTIYKITQDLDLGHGELILPSGCTLDFQGGSFSNGTIVGNDTKIKAGLETLFGEGLTLGGSWKPKGHIRWFGADESLDDNSDAIQRCLDAFTTTVIDKGKYNVKKDTYCNKKRYYLRRR